MKVHTSLSLLAIFVSFSINTMESLDQNLQRILWQTWSTKFEVKSVDKKKPFPEVLVQLIIEKHAKYGNIFSDEEQRTFVKYYQELDTILLEHSKDPLISPFGGINYAMTLDKMKLITEKKFNTLKKQGLIISEKEFEKIKDQYFTEHHHNDLSRIWGSEYLKDKINKSKELNGKYDTPSYIIVTGDPNKIKVKLWFDVRFPVIGFIKNATIYFKKITGEPVGCDDEVKKDIGEGTVIDYHDLCSGGITASNWRQNYNVLQESTGKRYIVDTEFSSFSVTIRPQELNTALHYGSKKFSYYNQIPITEGRHIKRPRDFYKFEFRLE